MHVFIVNNDHEKSFDSLDHLLYCPQHCSCSRDLNTKTIPLIKTKVKTQRVTYEVVMNKETYEGLFDLIHLLLSPLLCKKNWFLGQRTLIMRPAYCMKSPQNQARYFGNMLFYNGSEFLRLVTVGWLSEIVFSWWILFFVCDCYESFLLKQINVFEHYASTHVHRQCVKSKYELFTRIQLWCFNIQMNIEQLPIYLCQRVI